MARLRAARLLLRDSAEGPADAKLWRRLGTFGDREIKQSGPGFCAPPTNGVRSCHRLCLHSFRDVFHSPRRSFPRSEPRLDALGTLELRKAALRTTGEAAVVPSTVPRARARPLLPAAGATELTWEGYYRARGRFFDSLSVSNDASSMCRDSEQLETEGVSLWMDHRMRLQPNWLLSEHASLHAQLDLLPFLHFGEEPETITDPVSGDPLPYELSGAVVVPRPTTAASRRRTSRSRAPGARSPARSARSRSAACRCRGAAG
jgi:hypothetical protein